ncbi:MAG: TraR/DksA family transcriptional regulator [Pirellulaceae bacterium]
MSRKDAIKKLHETLVRRQKAIRRALKGDLSLFQELHQEKTGDILDAAADSVQDELNSQLIEVEARELNAIDDAIVRMEDGSYGECDGCGKSIPLTRLRAVPYATDCIECRRKTERKAKAGGISWNRVYDEVEVSEVDVNS